MADEAENIRPLLDQTFSEETLRRMCRKAGVVSIGRKEDLSLNDEIRSVALMLLRNICSIAVTVMDYKKVVTLSGHTRDSSRDAEGTHAGVQL